jgi:hypothetical protein
MQAASTWASFLHASKVALHSASHSACSFLPSAAWAALNSACAFALSQSNFQWIKIEKIRKSIIRRVGVNVGQKE